MRTLLWIVLGVIVLIGVAMISAGVVSVVDTEDEAGISVDKKKLEATADETVDETREAAGEVAESVSKGLQKASERLRDVSDDVDDSKAEPENQDAKEGETDKTDIDHNNQPDEGA